MSRLSEPHGLSAVESARIARVRRQRNIVLGLLLGGFVVLVFFISIAKMHH